MIGSAFSLRSMVLVAVVLVNVGDSALLRLIVSVGGIGIGGTCALLPAAAHGQAPRRQVVENPAIRNASPKSMNVL